VSDAAELVRIAGGPLEIEVLPAIGARVHRLRAFGHDLLRTPDDLRPHRDDPYFYGSYPMAPWCNRVTAGRVEVAGRVIDLPASFPDGTAIHGQVSRRAWRVAGDGRFLVEGGGDGWPWPYEVEQRIRIDGARLELGLRLTNRSDGAMPGGIGFHPWFRRPIRLAIAASSVHPSNLATDAQPIPVTGRLDRRRLEDMPDGLDATWTDLADPPVTLEWPAAGIRATRRRRGSSWPPASPAPMPSRSSRRPMRPTASAGCWRESPAAWRSFHPTRRSSWSLGLRSNDLASFGNRGAKRDTA
jgi:galactose mutarotase-like enzyme